MSNIHGFDFLRAEHNLPADATAFDSSSGPAYSAPSDSSPPTAAAAAAAAALHRSDLEKQFDVLKFLNAHRSSGCLPPHVILKSTGVHLNPASPNYEPAVAEMLSTNPKVRIDKVPDPENPTLLIPTYGYQAKFANVVDRTTLLAQINRCKNGVGVRDLIDSYDDVEEDINDLITAGDVLAVLNPEDKDRVLFPRGEQFLIELDGVIGLGVSGKYRDELGKSMKELQQIRDEVRVAAEADAKKEKKKEEGKKEEEKEGKKNEGGANASSSNTAGDTSATTAAAAAGGESSELRTQRLALAISKVQEARRRVERASHLVSTDVDPRIQIRRGEAINVGGTWFRVSSAIRDGLPLSEQPTRAQAPPSVVMMKDLSRKNDAEGYVRPFGERLIPLDHPLPEGAAQNLEKAKMARDKLHKVAGSVKGAGGSSRVGVTGGASSQLLSSNASAANPDTLASAFVSGFKAGIGGGAGGLAGGRKRPGVGRAGLASRAAGGAGRPNNKTSQSGEASSTLASGDKRSLAELVQEAKEAATDPSLTYAHARRHGCTKDVREMFLATRDDVPQSEVELYNLMIQHKLIEEGEPMRRPRMKLKNPNLDNDGKPKKRRYYERKNQRMTNLHLVGTEIGAVLAKAAERQQQGKSVGDGGM